MTTGSLGMVIGIIQFVKTIKSISIYSFVATTLFMSGAMACPAGFQSLANLPKVHKVDLCSIYDRYEAAVNKLKNKGIQSPHKIAGIYGPRFIDYPTWYYKAPNVNYDPTNIYNPAPTTWKKWAQAAEWVENKVQNNLANQVIEPISEKWIFELHTVAMTSLLDHGTGEFRDVADVGISFHRGNAISEKQVNAIANIEYTQSNNKDKIISYQATECFEEKSEEYRKLYDLKQMPFRLSDWAKKDKDNFFTDLTFTRRQCGYILYPPVEEVPKQMADLIKAVNHALVDIKSDNAYIDPVVIAARAQRWFVATHPFVDGNGRMSRFLMDYILKSMGLPAPILKDMNNDLYMTEQEWANEVAKGLEHTTKFIEGCAKRPDGEGCNVVND